MQSRSKGRSLWWTLHQLAGLQFSLYLSFILLTGTLAVLAHEIDWLLRPQMWVAPVAVDERVSWGTVTRAVEQHDPTLQIVNVYQPLHAAATFDVVVTRAGQLLHVYVHPRTGVVTGEGSWIGAQRLLRDAHRRLMIMDSIGNVRIGIVLVCLSAVYLLVTLVTSFWIYKKWWRGFLRLPRGPNARAFTGDLHRWVGLWSLWFVLVMTWTGLWYLFEEFTDIPAMPVRELAAPSAQPAAPADIHAALDLAVSHAAQQFPDLHVERVLWPGSEGAVMQLFGNRDGYKVIEPSAHTLWVDHHSGALTRARDADAFGLHQRVSATNNPLHFGTFAGYASKTVYFIFGVLLSGLGITGVMIYVLRMARADKEQATWRYGLRVMWTGMGRARWPALLLTLASFVLAPFVL